MDTKHVYYKASITFEDGAKAHLYNDSLLKLLSEVKHETTIAYVTDAVRPTKVRLSVMVSIEGDELGPYEIEHLEGV